MVPPKICGVVQRQRGPESDHDKGRALLVMVVPELSVSDRRRPQCSGLIVGDLVVGQRQAAADREQAAGLSMVTLAEVLDGVGGAVCISAP